MSILNPLSTVQKAINFLFFQAVWFACVVGAAKHHIVLGLVICAVSILWHIVFATSRANAIYLLLISTAIGGAFDQWLVMRNLVIYETPGWSAAYTPIWILALWLSFATALNVSMRWMRGNIVLQIILGAVGGILAYLGAEKLGAVDLSPLALWVLPIGWACITPLLFHLAVRFDGFESAK